MLTKRGISFMSYQFRVSAFFRAIPFRFDPIYCRLVNLGKWDTLIWKFVVLIQLESTLFIGIRLAQTLTSETLLESSIGFHVYWLIGYSYGSLQSIGFILYKTELRTSFNTSVKFDRRLTQKFSGYELKWDIFEIGFLLMVPTAYFQSLCECLLEITFSNLPQFHCSLANDVLWLRYILIAYDLLVLLTIWSSIISIIMIMAGVGYPLALWLSALRKISQGQNPIDDDLHYFVNMARLYRCLDVQMRIMNEWMVPFFAPVLNGLGLFAIILCWYNAIALFGKVPYSIYMVYPITAVVLSGGFFILIYYGEIMALDSEKCLLNLRQITPDRDKVYKKTLNCWKSYGIRVAFFYKLKPGIGRIYCQTIVDRVAELLLTF